MAPPQVKLNEKPPLSTVSEDPLPEKEKDGMVPVVIPVDNRHAQAAALQRRQRKKCRIACCASLTVLLLILLGVGAFCLAHRMRRHHRRGWEIFCGTKEMERRHPAHVAVDYDRKLITIKPNKAGWRVIHEYNRRMIAFKKENGSRCYIDRLDETFENGYTRLEGYEMRGQIQNHTMRVFAQPIEVDVVKHMADVHIYEHCGKEKVVYHWVAEVTLAEKRAHPGGEYITV